MCKINFRNEDCLETIKKIKEKNKKIDIVITSPPYNKSRHSSSNKKMKQMETYNAMYDGYDDAMDNEEYCQWQCKILNEIDNILIENGVILYNISYSNENPDCMWELIENIRHKTNFMIADHIIWIKKSALPQNVSHNKLTRLTENIFVLCRKNEYKTYNANKKVTKQNSKGQKYYENIYNIIKAPNNDGSCSLNKATYSSDLCLQLLNIYATKNSIVFDPFMGTGTTGVACEKFCQEDTMICIGCELSADQVQFSKDRLAKVREDIANGVDEDVRRRNMTEEEQQAEILAKEEKERKKAERKAAKEAKNKETTE